ncbi:Cation-ATPase-N domain-containing protein [Aphelenchoides besseyi]|nr:Cation-ATPase-N domain-containing protein [Aphelenchoides besseyi]
MLNLLRRLCAKSKSDVDSTSVNSERRREFGPSFVEHRLTIAQLQEIYADSYIDVLQPELSDGLSYGESNLPQSRNGPTGLNLLLNQHFYKFWILLLAASFISIGTHVFRDFTPDDDVTINPTTAYILIPVVVLMSALSFWQERRTQNSIEINQLTPQNCTVIRDSHSRIIPAESLVTGDLVFLFAGQRVSADCRILQSNALKIDNSSVTGRNTLVECHSDAVSGDVSCFDAKNLAFQGTFVVEGDGLGLVIKTGQFTFLGSVSDNIAKKVNATSLLRRDIKQTVHIISTIACSMALIFFVIGVVVSRFQNVIYYFIVGFLVIVVANVPQGMAPAVMTYLTITTQRLRAKSIFIKNLDTIDELGAATVVCSYKAGMFTENSLTVTNVFVNRKNHKISMEPMKNKPKYWKSRSDDQSKALEALHTVIGMCSRVWRRGVGYHSVRRARAASLIAANQRRESAFQPLRRKRFTVVHQTGEESIIAPGEFNKRPGITNSELNELNVGTLNELEDKPVFTANTIEPTCRNPSDDALRRYAESTGIQSFERLSRHYKPIYEIPYNSIRRWQLLICRCLTRLDTPLFPLEETTSDEAVYVVFVKGEVETILKRSSSYFDDELGIRLVDEEFIDNCLSTFHHYAALGNRTIAFALRYWIGPVDCKFSAVENNFPENGLIFLGMTALLDQPRSNVVNEVRELREAGIKLLIVTGDHPRSAMAFGKRIGIVPQEEQIFEDTLKLGNDWAVIHGGLLSSMSPKEIDMLMSKACVIFARTRPDQSLTIVEETQARGEIIAFVGNSVTDAPALLQANIGIASKQTTDIAVKSADIVLDEQSLTLILRGVESGRLLFENLQLSIAYTLAHLGPEVFPIILNFTLGLPLGITPMQILTIDLLCELPPAIALAYDRKHERNIMKCQPRQPSSRLVSINLLAYSYVLIGSIITSGCFLSYISVYMYNGVNLEHLFFHAGDFWHGKANDLIDDRKNVVYNATLQLQFRGQASAAWQITLVVAQIFHLFMCTTRRRSFINQGISSWAVPLAALLELMLLCIFIYTSFTRDLLGICQPPLFVWGFGVVTGLIIMFVSELRKYILRNRPKSIAAKLLDW